jgi:hypothetical protein
VTQADVNLQRQRTHSGLQHSGVHQLHVCMAALALPTSAIFLLLPPEALYTRWMNLGCSHKHTANRVCWTEDLLLIITIQAMRERGPFMCCNQMSSDMCTCVPVHVHMNLA